MDRDEQRYEDREDALEDEGVLERDETLDDDKVADPLDTGVEPADRWSGADRFGTTLAEQRQGESLDQLLAEEEPDVDPYPADPDDEDELNRRGYEDDPRAGRLVADDEGFGTDEQDELVGRDAGVDSGAATAEEAAMHLVEDPDGPGDGPLR